MDSTSPSKLLEKGKWREISPGKIPVKTTFTQKVKTGKRKGQLVKTTRTQMVLPSNALSGNYEIDFEKLDLEGVKFPTPDSLDRFHSHYGFEEPHQIKVKHSNPEVDAEHRDEVEKYGRDFYKVAQKQNEWERLHRSDTRKLQQSKNKLESKKNKTLADKLKIDKIKEEIAENEKSLSDVVGRDSPSWMDKYDVQIRPEAQVIFRGQRIHADIYFIPEAEKSVYIFEDMMGANHYLYTKGLGVERYRTSNGVYNRLKDIFSDRNMRLSLQLSSKFLEQKREAKKIKEKEENSEKLTSLLERSKQLENRVAQREKARKKELEEKRKARLERKKLREKEALDRIERKRQRIAKKRKMAKENRQRKAEREERRIARQAQLESEKRKKLRAKKKKAADKAALQASLNSKNNRKSKSNATRKSLISKMNDIIKEFEQNPELLKEDNSDESKFEMFSNFKSGDNTVTLECSNKQYKVSTNNNPVLTTPNLQEAMSKYYSSVSKIIDTQNEDKDIGLELFSDHVLQTSRNARKFMAELDKMVEVKMLESIDYSKIEFPFNHEFVIKADPTGDFFEIAPVPQSSDSVEAPSESGGKIGRKDLTEKEYKNKEKPNYNQGVIEEERQKGPNLGALGQNLITNSLNQPQMIPVRQEEAKRNEVIENPLKVAPSYQQTNHPKEQDKIEFK